MNRVPVPIGADTAAVGGTVQLNIVKLQGEGYGTLHQVPVRHRENGLAKAKADVGTTKKVKKVLNEIICFGEEAVFEAPIALVRRLSITHSA